MIAPTIHAFVVATCFAVGLGWAQAGGEDQFPTLSPEPSAKEIKTYLRAMLPTDAQQRRAAALIAKLGSPSFEDRQKAGAELQGMQPMPVQLLQEATAASDPEVRWRAKSLVDSAQAEYDGMLQAALTAIQQQQMKGLAAELIAIAPRCLTESSRHALQRALTTTVRAEDVPRLTQACDDESPATRCVALAALHSVQRGEVVMLAKKKLSDEDARVRLVAARVLAESGERDGLAPLIELLDAEELPVRVHASSLLRRMIGKPFQFTPYDAESKRAAAVAQWRTWLAKSGSTAQLNLPLPAIEVGSSHLNGHTLLAYGHRDRVVELDTQGNEIFEFKGDDTWSAEKLASGNILISCYGENRVVEVNMQGKVVWEVKCTTPLNARPLADGNVLVPAHTDSKIIEYNRRGEPVWTYKMSGLTCDAHRLPNGNTLVAGGKDVQEVTPEGEVVWQTQGKLPYGIEPLPSGNVIVCDLTGNRVFEVDRSGKEIWSLEEPRPTDAFRLPNGNTLITSNQRFFEITPDLRVVWEKEGCRYGTARR